MPSANDPQHPSPASTSGDTAHRVHRMPFGTEVTSLGVRFRIYAPAEEHVQLQIEGRSEPLTLDDRGGGWHKLVTTAAQAGSRYRFLFPDGTTVADPASRFQPEDAAGPSEVIDPAAYTWHDTEWKGRPWAEAVLYELHIGTFTQEGTFQAAETKLDHLRDTGITAIELMTITEFPGTRNWGYDGVLPYAPDSAYGRPEDLKNFVQAAHARGIAVIFDVVYNHFGPEGNDLPHYFPQICSKEHDTAWGKAFNFDGEGSAEVRAYFLENAVYWIEEYHADGLRIDASHAMIDRSPKHILDELAERVRAAAGDREVYLILEDEQNVSQRMVRGNDGSIAGYTAQWNHDMSHLLSAAFGNDAPDRDGNTEETNKTAKILAQGYVTVPNAEEHPDELMCRVPPNAYVAYTQTHDLIGNRIDAGRLDKLVPREAYRAAEAILLLLPQTPMLFMGQEWAASTPFPFFCDYHGDLAERVRKGRCEFLQKLHNADDETMKQAADPQAESTFRSAQLHWDEIAQEPHASELAWHRDILRVRSEVVVPLLKTMHERCGHPEVLAPGAIVVRWKMGAGKTLELAANLTGAPQANFPEASGRTLWLEGSEPDNGTLGPWTVRWTLQD